MATSAAVPTTTGETVTVACKMPHGLELRLFNMVDKREIGQGGNTFMIKEAQEVGERVRLNGFAHPQNKAPKSPIVGGYGLTFGVSKDFFDHWLEQNRDSDIVKNGLVFAHSKPGHTEGKAEEQKGIRSGLERLDPTRPPPGIKPLNAQAA